jgi:hypothetical protein
MGEQGLLALGAADVGLLDVVMSCVSLVKDRDDGMGEALSPLVRTKYLYITVTCNI